MNIGKSQDSTILQKEILKYQLDRGSVYNGKLF